MTYTLQELQGLGQDTSAGAVVTEDLFFQPYRPGAGATVAAQQQAQAAQLAARGARQQALLESLSTTPVGRRESRAASYVAVGATALLLGIGLYALFGRS